MNIHEFQAKGIFARHGMAIPKEKVARTPEEARRITEELGSKVVVKAQVHVGGRGKAGGVRLASTPDEAFEVAGRILGMDIKGLTVRQVLVAEAVEIDHEAYVGIILDRQTRRPVFMVSAAGGVDIEEVARDTPEKIHKLAVDPLLGLLPYQARSLAYKLYSDPAQVGQAAGMLARLYDAFIESDASLAEINPLVTTPEGKLWALDGKMNIDENALFRHEEIEDMRDPESEEPTEAEARDADLSFVKLDGDIGCIVNGAGLAMATMDIIKLHGGEPANFLDVGGGATTERVAEAFKLIMSDTRVRAILVNIFGGIVRCDLIAEGIISAVRETGLELPVVVRLEGTRVEEGKALLNESGLKIISADGLSDAADKVVTVSRGEN